MMSETGNNRVQGWRPAATLLAVAVAYYVGAQLGCIRRCPPTSPSGFWPRNGLPNLRAAAPHRHLAAGLLASGLFLASMGQFGNPSEFGLGLPAELSAPVAVLLPFLLWSAVRFGPGGLSVCLVATALLAVVAGTGESGIFVTQRAAEAVLSLQILLRTVAIPLMCLAAVIEERRQASEALATRLRLGEMLSRLSAAFVHLPSTEMHRALDEWLGRLGEHTGLDWVVIAEYSRTAADDVVG